MKQVFGQSTPLFRNENAPQQLRINDLLSKLTVEEKISLLIASSPGIPRLDVDKYYHGNEALHGVVRPGKFTVFPQAIALAAMWNPELLHSVATAISDEWKIFPVSEAVFLAIYSKKELGLMVMVRAPTAKEALYTIVSSNPDKKSYPTQFRHPNGNLITYDLDSPKDTWVIKSVNNKPVNRQFDRWPFFDGNIDGVKNGEEK